MWLNIFRYMFTSSSRSEKTLPNWIFQGPSKNIWRNDHVNSVTQCFSVYVYGEFQIRGNTAKLYFFRDLQNMYEEMTMLILWLNIFRHMFTSSSRSEATLPNYIFFRDLQKMYEEMTMLILRLNIFRWVITSSSRFEETLPNYIFSGSLQKCMNKWPC